MEQTVREGKKVWPYCSECGCRLNITQHNTYEVRLSHFGMNPDVDARGCRCSKRYTMVTLPSHRIAGFV